MKGIPVPTGTIKPNIHINTSRTIRIIIAVQKKLKNQKAVNEKKTVYIETAKRMKKNTVGPDLAYAQD